MTKEELLAELTVERWGHLHPEYRPSVQDREAAQQRDTETARALRLVVDNEKAS